MQHGIAADSGASDYKTSRRVDIENRGYAIIASVGDQKSDLAGGHAEMTFKIPNPFYFIPEKMIGPRFAASASTSLSDR